MVLPFDVGISHLWAVLTGANSTLPNKLELADGSLDAEKQVLAHDLKQSNTTNVQTVIDDEPPLVGEALAESLLADVVLFRDTAARRQDLLAAVERFYLDTLTCQWRVDALQAMLDRVQAVLDDAPCTGQDAGIVSDSIRGDQQAHEELSCRSPANRKRLAMSPLSLCLLDLDQQEQVAIDSLRERAQHYGVGVLATDGHLKRFSRTSRGRGKGFKRLRRVVSDTFAELRAEASELAEVATHNLEELRRCLPAVERKRQFWEDQLEETWAVWVSATADLHSTGEAAIRIWTLLANSVEQAVFCIQTDPDCVAMLLDCLSSVGSYLVQVEDKFSLGLADLEPAQLCKKLRKQGFFVDVGCNAGDAKDEQRKQEVIGWRAWRLQMIRYVLWQLGEVGLSEIGVTDGTGSQFGCCGTLTFELSLLGCGSRQL